MYRLVVLTIFVLGCDAGKHASFSFQSSDYVQPAAPVKLAVPVPVAPVVNSVPIAYASPAVNAAPVAYAVPAAPVQLAAPAPVAYAAPAAYAVPAPVSYGPVTAAVQTRRTIEFRNVDLPQDYAQPQIIEVQPNVEAVQIHFRTASSSLRATQSHIPAAVGPVEQNSYQDNAHLLVNEIVKPVIQEVREVIQPYRRITQEIRPVIEEVHTVVHKGEKRLIQAPLPLALAAPAYGPGAALSASYKAAKAAKAA